MDANEKRDLNDFLAGMYERLREHEKALNLMQVTAAALVESLGKIEPGFAQAYAESFAAIKAGPIGQALPVQLGLIDAVIRGLRNTE